MWIYFSHTCLRINYLKQYIILCKKACSVKVYSLLTKPVVLGIVFYLKINKKHILVFLRVSLSIILLGTLIWFCKPAETWKVMRSASLPNLSGALLLYILSMFIVAYRWKILLKVRNINIGMFRLTKFYLIGFFFNNFLPSSIGGDVSRIINLSSKNVPASISFSSVFVERLIGFLAMAALSICSLFFLIFALMQITSMVGIIPITLETAGTREWIYALVLVPLGYEKSVIVGAILLVRILSIAASSIGGVFFLTGDGKVLMKKEHYA